MLNNSLPTEVYPAYGNGVFASEPGAVVRRVKPVDRESEQERGDDKAEFIEGQLIEAMRAMPCRGTSFKEHYDVSAISIEYAWQTNPDRYLPSACSMYVQLCETDVAADTDANDVLNCLILAAVKLVDDLKALKVAMRGAVKQ